MGQISPPSSSIALLRVADVLIVSIFRHFSLSSLKGVKSYKKMGREHVDASAGLPRGRHAAEFSAGPEETNSGGPAISAG